MIVPSILLAACGSSPAAGPELSQEPVDTISAAGVTAEIPPAAASATPTTRLTQTLPPSLTFTPTVDGSSAECNRAQFVADISIPDEWETGPNVPFTKTWRMKNTGKCTWTSVYKLVFDHGDRMNAPDSQPLTEGTVAPDGTIDISVDLTSPPAAGAYQAFFKLQSADGATFGIGADTDTAFWVKIVVTNESQPPAASPKIEVTSDRVTVAARSQKPFNVACPEGTVVTGGGFTASTNGLYFFGEYKEGNGWTVVPDSVVTYDVDMTVYAICLTLPRADTSQSYETFPVPARSTVTKSVDCPAGSIVTGGGFSKNLGSQLSVIRNSRYMNGWQVTARNNYYNDGLMYVNVVCLYGTSLASTSVTGYADIAPDGDGYAEAKCPAGKAMTGIGWFFGDNYLEVDTVIPHGAAWRVHAFNLLDYGNAERLNANGVCLGAP